MGEEEDGDDKELGEVGMREVGVESMSGGGRRHLAQRRNKRECAYAYYSFRRHKPDQLLDIDITLWPFVLTIGSPNGIS